MSDTEQDLPAGVVPITAQRYVTLLKKISQNLSQNLPADFTASNVKQQGNKYNSHLKFVDFSTANVIVIQV